MELVDVRSECTFTRVALVWNEGASDETSETELRTKDPQYSRVIFEAERSRPMDSKSADVLWKSGSRHTKDCTRAMLMAAAVSIYGRHVVRPWKSGERLRCGSTRHRVPTRFKRHDQSSNTGTQSTRS